LGACFFGRGRRDRYCHKVSTGSAITGGPATLSWILLSTCHPVCLPLDGVLSREDEGYGPWLLVQNHSQIRHFLVGCSIGFFSLSKLSMLGNLLNSLVLKLGATQICKVPWPSSYFTVCNLDYSLKHILILYVKCHLV